MALIEKGIDASIFIKEETTFHKVLLWGMLIGGIGLGLLLGYIFSVYTPMRQEIIMPIMALLFGGLGLIGYYVYRKKTETKSAQ
jgi:ABC-type Mn2+/Zn2+ transport system permease subunit